MRCLLSLAFALPIVLASGLAHAQGARPPEGPIVVASPDGQVRAEITLKKAGDDPSVPHLRVTFGGKPVILESTLRVDMEGGWNLGSASVLRKVETREVHGRYRQFPGKRTEVIDRANEATITLVESGPRPVDWQVLVRASDDGVAFRYRFPKQAGWDALVVAGERTTFALPADAKATALPLKNFRTSHEARYVRGSVDDLPADPPIGLPILFELPGTGWAAIAEANLTDYAGLYLARDGHGLVSRLSPLPDEPGVAVRANLPHDSPWRVVLIGDAPGRLIESDLVLNLNEPCAIADISWIKPGKTTFPWWNGFHEVGVPFTMGLNTETANYYIDFCAEAGIPYHSLDGLEGIAWYGGRIQPYGGGIPTAGLPGLDLEAVIHHADAKGVKLRFWMHWEAAQIHMKRAFPLYREWGIEGVMLDFMDRDDQEMVRFLRDVLALAAENHLTVTLHGVAPPTGLERTYPNLLTHEGVMNLEYDKWDKIGITPDHELTVPFTRMLAGPLDFHQGSFRTVPVEQFAPQSKGPRIMGTPCRTLASYVVLQNHLPMAADYPSAYRGHPALPILVAIPTTWDDTKVLSGVPGESIAIARRSGPDWWVGAMTDRDARKVRIPLEFLGDGRFRAEITRDDLGAPGQLDRETRDVVASDSLQLQLAPAGGLVIRIGPAD